MFLVILIAGLIAGILDASAAIINFVISTGKNPVIVFQYIASGIFGRKAFDGGWQMPGWGLFFHFCIAFLFSLFFFVCFAQIRSLFNNRILAGIFYGIFAWLVMSQVVVPLSNAHKLPFDPVKALIAVGILIVAVGLPISLIAHNYYSKK